MAFDITLLMSTSDADTYKSLQKGIKESTDKEEKINLINEMIGILDRTRRVF